MSRQRGILEETPRDTGDELLGERSYPGEEQSSNEHNETAVPAPPPPAPRIVEGTVIESILLSSAAGEATETEDTPPPAALHPSGQLTRRTRLVRIGVFITAWMIPVVLVGLTGGPGTGRSALSHRAHLRRPAPDLRDHCRHREPRRAPSGGQGTPALGEHAHSGANGAHHRHRTHVCHACDGHRHLLQRGDLPTDHCIGNRSHRG
jgi:hypothetical protein